MIGVPLSQGQGQLQGFSITPVVSSQMEFKSEQLPSQKISNLTIRSKAVGTHRQFSYAAPIPMLPPSPFNQCPKKEAELLLLISCSPLYSTHRALLHPYKPFILSPGLDLRLHLPSSRVPPVAAFFTVLARPSSAIAF